MKAVMENYTKMEIQSVRTHVQGFSALELYFQSFHHVEDDNTDTPSMGESTIEICII